MQQTLLITGNAPRDLHRLSDGPDGPKPCISHSFPTATQSGVNQPGCMLSVLIPLCITLLSFGGITEYNKANFSPSLWYCHSQSGNKDGYGTTHGQAPSGTEAPDKAEAVLFGGMKKIITMLLRRACYSNLGLLTLRLS